jgi:DNA-binding response OmpR family regulator
MVAALSTTEIASSSTESLRVLVVEDDPDTAGSLALCLRLNGHEVDIASDEDGALRAVDANDPDVILLDMGLPRLEDGLEVARQVKHRPAERHPLLVAITGFKGNADELRSIDAGVDLYLVKPADPTMLLDFLARYAEEMHRLG